MSVVCGDGCIFLSCIVYAYWYFVSMTLEIPINLVGCEKANIFYLDIRLDLTTYMNFRMGIRSVCLFRNECVTSVTV